MTLSVVIPAYNEEENIEKCVLDVRDHFPAAEIIVVNDCSNDNTFAILQKMRERYANLKVLSHTENMGHGVAVVNGLTVAQGDWILYIDADRQIDLSNLAELDNIDPSEFDMVSGWRVQRSDKLFRKLISFGLKMTNLLRHGMYIKDANCPFKLYRRQAIRPLLAALPETYVIPIACMEVIARKRDLKTLTIKTAHKPYEGVREGFLQMPNLTVLKFCVAAFKEITSI